MTEWGVVGVIIALVGLIGVAVEVSVRITTAIKELGALVAVLTTQLSSLTEKLAGIDDGNSECHKRIFDKLDGHTIELEDHEKRIYVIEHHERKGVGS